MDKTKGLNPIYQQAVHGAFAPRGVLSSRMGAFHPAGAMAGGGGMMGGVSSRAPNVTEMAKSTMPLRGSIEDFKALYDRLFAQRGPGPSARPSPAMPAMPPGLQMAAPRSPRSGFSMGITGDPNLLQDSITSFMKGAFR